MVPRRYASVLFVRRYDFETEEEWQRYKETREQAPKAAFQFGVKVADGRKGGKEMVSSGWWLVVIVVVGSCGGWWW